MAACTEAEKVEAEAITEDLVVEAGDEAGNSGAAPAPPSEAAAPESLESEPLNGEVAVAELTAASDPETRIRSVAPAESTSSESGKVEDEEGEDGSGTIGLHQIEGKTLYLRL